MTQIPPSDGDPFGLGAGDGGTPPEDENPRPGRGRMIAVICLSVLAAILIGLIAWLLIARANPAPAPTTSPTVSPSPTQTSSPSSTSTATPAVQRCTTDVLTLSLGQSNGAAGSIVVPIIFTNKGSVSCELHGFPGVSFVGDGNGTQLGAAADEDTTVPITANTLAPGASVQAQVKIEQAGNFSDCTIVPADGFRVYPPHSYDSVFVAGKGFSACSNSSTHLLKVQPVGPAQ